MLLLPTKHYKNWHPSRRRGGQNSHVKYNKMSPVIPQNWLHNLIETTVGLDVEQQYCGRLTSIQVYLYCRLHRESCCNTWVTWYGHVVWSRDSPRCYPFPPRRSNSVGLCTTPRKRQITLIVNAYTVNLQNDSYINGTVVRFFLFGIFVCSITKQGSVIETLFYLF